jgi:hypothetical protein
MRTMSEIVFVFVMENLRATSMPRVKGARERRGKPVRSTYPAVMRVKGASPEEVDHFF